MMCTAASFIAQGSTKSLYCAVLLPRDLGQQHKHGEQTKLMKTHLQLTPFVVKPHKINDENCGEFNAGLNVKIALVIAFSLMNKGNESSTYSALFMFVLQPCVLTRFTHRAEWVGSVFTSGLRFRLGSYSSSGRSSSSTGGSGGALLARWPYKASWRRLPGWSVASSLADEPHFAVAVTTTTTTTATPCAFATAATFAQSPNGALPSPANRLIWLSSCCHFMIWANWGSKQGQPL